MWQGLWNGAYGLSFLSEKTTKSNRLQMLLQKAALSPFENKFTSNKDFDCKGYKNLLANLGQHKKFQPFLYNSLSN